MKLIVQGLDTDLVENLISGGVDSYGNPRQAHTAEDATFPCRHCLQLIKPGEHKLVMAYRPFTKIQPYAETGPIFLHQHPCRRYCADEFPDWFAFLDPALVRGYDADDWIVYETGCVVAGADIAETCRQIFKHPEVSYIHVRSKYNCFQCRVDRG